MMLCVLYTAVYEACAQNVQELFGAFSQSLLQQRPFSPCNQGQLVTGYTTCGIKCDAQIVLLNLQ